jgi:hypothetical protein
MKNKGKKDIFNIICLVVGIISLVSLLLGFRIPIIAAIAWLLLAASLFDDYRKTSSMLKLVLAILSVVFLSVYIMLNFFA